jgi:hypothetical protein
VMMIFAGACSLLMAFTLPETYVPVILLAKVRFPLAIVLKMTLI